ncbi:MAG: sugar 3,4-ketoisomerase [Gemmatimonadaceae bacterium]
MSGIDECTVLPLRRIPRREGQITPVEGGRDIPFEVARVYYLYDVPGGETRGGHAHRELQQLVVSVMGSFDVLLDDGERKKVVTLNRAYNGLYIPRLVWRDLLNFSSGSVCLVLASLAYDEAEYIRNYDEFLRHKQADR